MKKKIYLIVPIVIVLLIVGILFFVPAQNPLSNTETPTSPPAEVNSQTEPTLAVEQDIPKSTETTHPTDTVDVIWENAEVVSYKNSSEYAKTINELGFSEFVLEQYTDEGLACKPIQLTYTDNTFKLDFQYQDYAIVDNQPTEDLAWVSGWSLYGAKSEAERNISDMNLDEYENVLIFDVLEHVSAPIRSLDICPTMTMYYCVDVGETGDLTPLAFYQSVYYPTTGNLYNFTNSTEAAFNAPNVLQSWHESLREGFISLGKPMFSFVGCRLNADNSLTADGTMFLSFADTKFCFDYGMTLEEWANSVYNTRGWTFEKADTGGLLFSPDKKFVVISGYDSNGKENTIEYYKNEDVYELYALSYDDYLKSTN